MSTQYLDSALLAKTVSDCAALKIAFDVTEEYYTCFRMITGIIDVSPAERCEKILSTAGADSPETEERFNDVYISFCNAVAGLFENGETLLSETDLSSLFDPLHSALIDINAGSPEKTADYLSAYCEDAASSLILESGVDYELAAGIIAKVRNCAGEETADVLETFLAICNALEDDPPVRKTLVDHMRTAAVLSILCALMLKRGEGVWKKLIS